MTENKQTGVDEHAEIVISINDLLFIFRKKWHWFVLSLALFFCAGGLYLMVTAPTYTRMAALLIKDERQGSSTATDLMKLGVFQARSNIDNEMLTLQSPSLMEEVVVRLKLNDSYSVKQGLRRVDLYKSAPFVITAVDDTVPEFLCNVVVAENGRNVELSEFMRYRDKEEFADVVNAELGDTVCTPVGRLHVSMSPWEDSELYLGMDVLFSHLYPENISQSYAAKVVTELGSEKGTIINISFGAPSIAKAEDILNTLIQVYNDRWVLDKNQVAVSTSHFISERLGVIEGELGNVDSDISSFKSQHLMPDLEIASEMYMRQNEDNAREISEIANQLKVARSIRDALSGEDIEHPLPVATGLQSNEINQQISEYNTSVLERNRLLAGSSAANPLVKELTQELVLMRANIVGGVDNLIGALDTRVSGLKSRQASTAGHLAANPNQAKYLLSVERQQKVKEQLYLYLLQKREENELNQAFTSYNTRLITPPLGSKSPSSPSRRNVMIICFLLGMVVPAGIIYVRLMLDDKVRSRRDLESLTIPYVGEVPLANPARHGLKRLTRRSNVRTDDKVLVESGNNDVINEAFRIVRSNLEFIGDKSPDDAARTFMVTSAVPGSGKTFVSMNLGAVMALKGKRVIVVDLDMRRASLSLYVGRPRRGISSVLIGRTPLDDAIVSGVGGIRNLSVLPVGALPPNPAELMYTPRFSGMMEKLKAEYDCVVLDCPPAEVVADAKIISRFVDLTIWVVRAGLFEKVQLPRLQQYYDERRYRSLCVLLNGTDPTNSSAYNRYYYSKYYHSYTKPVEEGKQEDKQDE